MEHSFDIEIAKQYGIEEAVLLKNLYHWTQKNKANNKHFHDGKYWTYNSSKAFKEMFPYMSERTILRKLSNLQEKGLIEIGNFNETKYDRTQWYALTSEAIILIERPSDKMANPSDNLANGNAQNGGPIPNNNTNNITNNKYKTQIEQIVNYLNLVLKTRYSTKSSKTHSLVSARLNEGYSVEDFKLVIDQKYKDWNDTDYSKYLRPETLFSPKFEGYLNSALRNKPKIGDKVIEEKKGLFDINQR